MKELSQRIVRESLDEIGFGHLDEGILSGLGSAAKALLNKVRNLTTETAIFKYLKHRYSDAGREEMKFLEQASRLIKKLNNNEFNDPEVRSIFGQIKSNFRRDDIIGTLEKRHFQIQDSNFRRSSAAVEECLNVIAAMVSGALGTAGIVGNLMMGEDSREIEK